MEPPSPALLAALRDLRLASPRDLRAAARRCRLLARDLPTFDSVWLDALVGLRRLTPFQADRLADGRADRLLVGRYVLIDRLGGDADGATYLARPIDGDGRCVVKDLVLPPDRAAATRERLERLVDAAYRSRHLVGPHAVETRGERTLVVSRFVAGETLRRRLVRHGRFPAAAVAEIARQLLDAIAECGRLGLPHGDVRAEKVILTPRGEAVLVDAGLRPAVTPVLTVHDPRPPEWYDGVAPERIGTGSPPTVAADLFALGCLLWQLLAGRAPFPIGDPLARLAAHRHRPVPDVRDFAPDAPPELTGLIDALTAASPDDRPEDPAEAARRLKSAARRGQAVLVRGHGIPSEKDAGRFAWATAAALVFALSGATLFFADRGATGPLLATGIGRFFPSELRPTREATAVTAAALAQLPPPDERGVLTIEHAGPFAAASVAFRGPLVIRGRADRPAVIVVSDRPLHAWGDEVTIENVVLRQEPSNGFTSSPPALLLAESQNLTLRGCRFEGAADVAPAAIAWRMIDRADPTGGRISVADTVVRRTREALFAADPPREVTFADVLMADVTNAVTLKATRRNGLDIALKNVTVRSASSVVAVRSATLGSAIRVAADDSVLALKDGASLFDVAAGATVGLEWSGRGVVTAGEVASVSTPSSPVRTADGRGSPPPSAEVDGLLRADVVFAGPPDGPDSANAAAVRGTPRAAGHLLGVDLAKLPPTPR